MIGLQRHTVKVFDYDPGWARLGFEACHLVKDAGGALIADVQHIGSTAVPNLPAKPVLDLAAALSKPDALPRLSQRLATIGYIYQGDGGDAGGHLFILESEPDIRIIHLHVVPLDSAQWTNYIRFREILRQDFNVRMRYAKLKLALSTQFPNDREAYTNAKHDFIREILESNLHPELPSPCPAAGANCRI